MTVPLFAGIADGSRRPGSSERIRSSALTPFGAVPQER